MKNFCLILLVTLWSCSDNPEISDVFKDFDVSTDQIPADGQSTAELVAVLTSDASADRRKVIFKTTSGSFGATGNSITITAVYENGKLVARATLTASTRPGQVSVSVQPEFDSSVGEFVLSKNIAFTNSVPVSLELETSSYGIGSNFTNSILLTGILRNAEGKNVSENYEVIFEDLTMSNSAAPGQFIEQHLLTQDSSKVSARYQAGSHVLGEQIKIVCRLQNSTVSDTLIININE